MKCIQRLQVACLIFIAGMPSLVAQGYETKFKAVGFKPGDVYHSDENVQVSLNGGGLEVSIPLGPAMPGPIPIRPMAHYHGKYLQSLNSSTWQFQPTEIESSPCLESGDLVNYRRYLPPRLPFGEIHPGYMYFSVGAGHHVENETIVLVAPDTGKSSGYYLGMPGTYTYRSDRPSDVTEINTLVSTLTPEWVPMGGTPLGCPIPNFAGSFRTQPLGTTIGTRLSTGGTLIFGPSNAEIYSLYPLDMNGYDTSTIWAAIITIPNEILQIDDNLITLWRRSRNVYHKQVEKVRASPHPNNDQLADRESQEWEKSVYHPVWVKNRDDFKVSIETYHEGGESPSGLVGLGALTGFKVSSNNGDTWFQVGAPSGTTPEYPVSFGGMGIPGTSGITLLKGSGGQSFSGPDDNWQPGTLNGYNNCPYWVDEESRDYSSMNFTANVIVYDNQTTSFQWGGPYGLLSGLTTPNGKTYTFDYEILTGFGVDHGCAGIGVPAWDYAQVTPNAKNFWSAVTRMDISDGDQTRSTYYHWKIPQVDHGIEQSKSIYWASPRQGVAQTLPDGQTILHVFAPAVDLSQAILNELFFSSALSLDALETGARTFMANRQAIIARYYYAQGETSWNNFLSNGTDPDASVWYKRELMEGFDFRNWTTSFSKITTNTEPRPTRTIIEEKNGPVEVREMDGWNAGRNQYAISRVYHLPPGTTASGQAWAPGLFSGSGTYPPFSSAIDLAETTTTFAPIEVGLHARPQTSLSIQLSTPSSGTTGNIKSNSFEYNSGPQAHLVREATQKATDNSLMEIKTNFTYSKWGNYTRMRTAGLSGSWTSGTAGYTYNYDDTGRWLSSIQIQGLAYKEEEPSHDWEGNPTSLIDANGIETTYSWDDYGRVTGIFPPSPEAPTAITYDTDFRGAIVTRDKASTHYRYNSFGELTSIEKPSGKVKTFGYDAAGRLTFESVWSGTIGTTTSYDTQGRLKKVVSPNGDITDYAYPSPMSKTITQYPYVNNIPATTTTTLVQDTLGRLASVTNANGEVTKYTYDPVGRLTKIEQGVQVRNWNFNGFGWLSGLVQPESGTTTYSDFSILGKPKTTNYAGKVVTTSYDILGRVTDVTAPGVQSVSPAINQHFEFDGGSPFNGKLRWSSEPGIRLDFSYQGLNGRLDSLTTTLGTLMGSAILPLVQNFGYDNLGNITSSTLPSGRDISYDFDPLREVPKEVKAKAGIPGAFDGTYSSMAAVFQFNNADLATLISLPNGAATALSYGADQTRLAGLTHMKVGPNAFSRTWTYTWDTAGQLLNDGEDSYEYDNLARLVKASLRPLGGESTITQNFTYDTYGNQLLRATSNVPTGLDRNFANFSFKSADLAVHNRLPLQTSGSGSTGAAYDAQGNLVQVFKQVGASGRSLSLTYDALGRVCSMFDSETGITEVYGYSPEGLRTKTEIWQGSILQKIGIRIYNPLRQLVSIFEVE